MAQSTLDAGIVAGRLAPEQYADNFSDLHPPLTRHEAIVEAAQLSIPEIFAQFGEPYFRDGERRVIARLRTPVCSIFWRSST